MALFTSDRLLTVPSAQRIVSPSRSYRQGIPIFFAHSRVRQLNQYIKRQKKKNSQSLAELSFEFIIKKVRIVQLAKI